MSVQNVQKTNAQHPIPQNFMDVEFKIIGSLTMRQFIYLLVFFGSAYGVWSLMNSVLKVPIAIFSVLLGLGLAFMPLEERGLDEWIVNFFKSIYSPSQRVWRKSPELPSAFTGQGLAVVHQELITLAPTSSRRKLEEYLHSRDAEQEKADVLDIPESYYTEKVRQAFMSERASPKKAQSQAPPVSVGDASAQATPQKTLKDVSSQSAVDKKPSGDITTVKEEIDTPAFDKSDKSKDLKDIRDMFPPNRPSEIPLTPMTPDRHSGRRFVDLTPGRGHIILPIRGEKTLGISEQNDESDNIEKKTAQLQQLLSQIRNKSPAPTRQTLPSSPEGEKVFTDVVALKKDVKDANPKQPDMQSQTAQNPGFVPPVPTVVAPSAKKVEEQVPLKTLTAASSFEIPGTNIPNVIYGVVKDNNGKTIPNIVLIIKDSSGAPVRAIKSNSLGQFNISSPLADGKYTLEVDSTKKTNLSFDIISVPLVGSVLPPMEVVGK